MDRAPAFRSAGLDAGADEALAAVEPLRFYGMATLWERAPRAASGPVERLQPRASMALGAANSAAAALPSSAATASGDRPVIATRRARPGRR